MLRWDCDTAHKNPLIQCLLLYEPPARVAAKRSTQGPPWNKRAWMQTIHQNDLGGIPGSLLLS